MSVDYFLVCHKHKEKVYTCSDGLSGPLLQCDRSLASFCITHRDCNLRIVDEDVDRVCKYEEWDGTNWKSLLTYDK
jgi:hypothetical protein